MILTKQQRQYLCVIGERGTLQSGWGGYNSRRVVRCLAQKGLITLKQSEYPKNKWTAQLTSVGRTELENM